MVLLRDGLGNGEPQAEAALLPPGGVRPVEALKEPGQLLRRDGMAAAAVGNGENCLTALRPQGEDDALAGSAVLGGVVQKDGEEATELLPVAGDGEGATKLLECVVTGAAEESVAKTVAKSVICSSLTKAAMFGADANWGRVLCAIGYSGAPVDIHKVDVAFKSPAGTVEVCKNGAGIEFSEEEAKKVLLEKEITIQVELNSGTAGAVAWGCDLTYEYVKINGDYRT